MTPLNLNPFNSILKMRINDFLVVLVLIAVLATIPFAILGFIAFLRPAPVIPAPPAPLVPGMGISISGGVIAVDPS